MAQPTTELLRKHLPPTKFQDEDYQDVFDRAEREYRLVVVYIRNPGDPATPEMDRRVWNNPTLAAHVRWHSLAYKFDFPENPALAYALGIKKRKETPAVVVLRVFNGKPQVLEVMRTLRNLFVEEVMERQAAGVMGLQVCTGGIADIYPGTLKVLESTDTELQMIRARDPAWAGMHDQMNPEPKPPGDPDPIYEVGDEAAPAVLDPEPLRGTPDIAGKIDVYDRLEDARAAAADGDLYLATGLYTWLWERADKADPAFRAAKRSVISQEMLELAKQRPYSRDRFKRLREYYDERLLWTTYESLGDWFLLNGVVAEEAETVAYLDLFLNDLDEGSMLPEPDKLAYRLLVGRDMSNDAWDLGERPMLPVEQIGSDSEFRPVRISVTQRAARLLQPHAGGRGKDMTEEEKKKIDDFRRVFAVDECSRLHAACLRAGREQDAWKIADLLVQARPEAEVKHILVATALAAGQVRQRHALLLDETRAAGIPHPVLWQRVSAVLAEQPVAAPAPNAAIRK